MGEDFWVQVVLVALVCLMVVAVASRRRAVLVLAVSVWAMSCAVWGGLMALQEMWWSAVLSLASALVLGAVALGMRRGRSEWVW
jgi:hypothetical protein